VITLRTWQKYLKNRKLLLLSIGYFVVAITITLLIAFKKHGFSTFDPGEIEEKDVAFWKVFSSNLLLVLKVYFFGIITVCLYALFSYLQNVISIGLVASGLLSAGYDKLAIKMIPHGFFEFWGISLAVATVTWAWGVIVYYAPSVIKRKTAWSDVGKRILNTVIVSVILNCLLLAVAAIVEVIVSWYKVL